MNSTSFSNRHPPATRSNSMIIYKFPPPPEGEDVASTNKYKEEVLNLLTAGDKKISTTDKVGAILTLFLQLQKEINKGNEYIGLLEKKIVYLNQQIGRQQLAEELSSIEEIGSHAEIDEEDLDSQELSSSKEDSIIFDYSDLDMNPDRPFSQAEFVKNQKQKLKQHERAVGPRTAQSLEEEIRRLIQERLSLQNEKESLEKQLAEARRLALKQAALLPQQRDELEQKKREGQSRASSIEPHATPLKEPNLVGLEEQTLLHEATRLNQTHFNATLGRSVFYRSVVIDKEEDRAKGKQMIDAHLNRFHQFHLKATPVVGVLSFLLFGPFALLLGSASYYAIAQLWNFTHRRSIERKIEALLKQESALWYSEATEYVLQSKKGEG